MLRSRPCNGRVVLEKIKRTLRKVEFWLGWAGAAVTNYAWVDPTTALVIYNAMPDLLQAVLPQNILMVVGAGLFGLDVLASFAKQKRRKKNTNADENG